MMFKWDIFINLGIISLALLIATFIRSKIKFFQKYLIPNALTAGFILLPLYNYVFPLLGFETGSLKDLAYHFLGMSFVVLTLKNTQKKTKENDGATPMAVAVLFQYSIQLVVGLLLTLGIIATFRPDLFHSFGVFLTLGFALGPGQALSIGTSWGNMMSIEGLGSVGLTFAAIGFIVCCFGGIYLINFAIRNKWITPEELSYMGDQGTRRGIFFNTRKDLPIGSYLTTESEAVDTLTLHAGLVVFSYFLSYLLLQGLTLLLSLAGDAGMQLADSLWGINFIFAAFTGMLMRRFLVLVKAEHIVDNMTMNRVSGYLVDIMVTAAIAAISIAVVANYWLPILIVTVIGGIITVWSVIFIGSRLFRTHRFFRTLMIFGVSTGTLSTGLALLRVVDPDFKTPVVEDYTLGAGIVFIFAIPLILFMTWPVRTFITGNWLYFWMFFGLCLLYLVGCIIYYVIKVPRHAFKDKRQIWLKKK
ncbi:MAG: sodium:glutamate symporter [Candidatus Marinimicrobia bacterium]|nr:sodium:glutamate symporter [Candidatus Neomarinimicrobiota bacterium]MDD4960837.1 sodium:glutamate symporter [Candidatus Neomarinimicrobiota bacterium]MDD5709687.1 sodium:glutamate symporter [Candidatus Neomarinimicrobiota bacterium]